MSDVLQDYAQLSAGQIGLAVRGGELARADVVGAAFARAGNCAGLEAICEFFNPPLTGAPDGPLAGVPILVKDLSFPVAGRACANGSDFPAAVAEANAILLDRYLAAGATVIGRSHSPEFGGGSSCESRHWGLATRNPYAPDRSSGGSSGGAAAAVAAGIVPVAHASDAGGSITIPAALCGVVGLKPTHGLVPLGPERVEGAAGFAAQNALTRTMGDAALALCVAADQPELAGGQPQEAPLRILLAEGPIDGLPTSAAIAARVLKVADRLRALGHRVAIGPLPPLSAIESDAERTLRLASLAATISGLEQRTGTIAREADFEPATWARLAAGRAISGAEVLMARDRILAYRDRFLGLFEHWDIILSPALNAPAPPLHALSLMRPDAETQPLNRHYTCFTRPWNLTGAPSLCLPLTRDDRGHPEGVLFGAKPGGDALLLALGLQLEQQRAFAHDHLQTDYLTKDRNIS